MSMQQVHIGDTLDVLSVAPLGQRWAVKHNGSVLGFAGDQHEALRLARGLLDWLDSCGRPAELLTEERTWAQPSASSH